jgi:hypothetical protein
MAAALLSSGLAKDPIRSIPCAAHSIMFARFVNPPSTTICSGFCFRFLATSSTAGIRLCASLLHWLSSHDDFVFRRGANLRVIAGG